MSEEKRTTLGARKHYYFGSILERKSKPQHAIWVLLGGEDGMVCQNPTFIASTNGFDMMTSRGWRRTLLDCPGCGERPRTPAGCVSASEWNHGTRTLVEFCITMMLIEFITMMLIETREFYPRGGRVSCLIAAHLNPKQTTLELIVHARVMLSNHQNEQSPAKTRRPSV